MTRDSSLGQILMGTFTWLVHLPIVISTVALNVPALGAVASTRASVSETRVTFVQVGPLPSVHLAPVGNAPVGICKVKEKGMPSTPSAEPVRLRLSLGQETHC